MKNCIRLFFLLFFVAGLYAQNAGSTGLTDSDVKNWAKNYESIQKEFKKIGVDADDAASISAKKKSQVDAILQKNGISGSNCIEKLAMIQQCATLLMAEEELDEQSRTLMKSMGIDPLAQLKANVSAKDYVIVAANSKAVLETMGEIDAAESSRSASDSEMENPYLANAMSISTNMTKAAVQPKIDEMNEAATVVKTFYESLQKSRGDCGFIYKTEDASGASEYEKRNITASALEIGNSDISGTADFKKKTIVLKFSWTEASFDAKASDYIKKTPVEKVLKFGIKSAELYKAGDREKYGDMRTEYVLTTKEGPIIHLWKSIDFSGNAMVRRMNFKGMQEPNEEFGWREL